jgi:hypothetical protein
VFADRVEAEPVSFTAEDAEHAEENLKEFSSL